MAEGETTATKKKYLGQTPLAWGLEIGAAVVLFLLYRRYRSSSGSTTGGTASGPSTALLGGSTVPAAVTSTATTQSTPSSFSAWVDAALATLAKLAPTSSFTTASAYDAITSWQNGQCVSHAGFSYLSTLISKLGLPPDGIAYPVTVCSGSKAQGTPGHATTPKSQTPGTGPTPLTVTEIKQSLGNLLKGLGTLTAEPGGYGLSYKTGAVQGLTGGIFQTIGGTFQNALDVVGAGTPVYVMTGRGTVREFATAQTLTAYEKENGYKTTTWQKLTPAKLAA